MYKNDLAATWLGRRRRHEWTHSYFVEPGRLVLSWTDDKEKDKENCERCRAALKVLESETDAKGRLAS